MQDFQIAKPKIQVAGTWEEKWRQPTRGDMMEVALCLFGHLQTFHALPMCCNTAVENWRYRGSETTLLTLVFNGLISLDLIKTRKTNVSCLVMLPPLLPRIRLLWFKVKNWSHQSSGWFVYTRQYLVVNEDLFLNMIFLIQCDKDYLTLQRCFTKDKVKPLVINSVLLVWPYMN